MNNKDLIERESTKQIKKGALISYVAIFINILSGILYTPWMLEQIGVSNYSLYTLATSIIVLFTVDFGLGSAITRFVSKYNAEKTQESVNNFLGIVYKMLFLISGVISIILIVLFFFLDSIYLQLSVDELFSLKVIYIITSFYTVVTFPFISLNGILTSYEKFVHLKLADIFNKIGTILFIVIALLNGLGLYTLVTINAVFNLLTVVLKLIIVKHKTPVKVNFKYWDTTLIKTIFNYSIWVTIGSLAQRLIFNITPTILGISANTTAIAFFGLASTLEGYVYMISHAISGMFLPKISRIMHNSEDNENLLLLMIKLGRINLSIIGLIIIEFIILGQEFIILWIGKEYLSVYICVVLLIIPTIIHIPQQIANSAVIVANKVKEQAFIFIIVGVFNIILSFVLSYFIGAIGASVSICIAYFGRLVLMNILYHKTLHINIFRFFKECHIKMLNGLLLTLVCSFVISKFINIHNAIINFGAKGFALVIIFSVIMWFTAWNKYEKSLISSTIKNIFIKLLKIIKQR